jgi:outer membrane protein assembly factor BamA
MDVGNIWHTRANELDPDQIFHFNNFYKQLGLNTGVGVRINISIAVLRLDWGIRLHDPNLPAGERWVIKHPTFTNTALSLGVNYPF